jgi:hypothetical protein
MIAVKLMETQSSLKETHTGATGWVIEHVLER